MIFNVLEHTLLLLCTKTSQKWRYVVREDESTVSQYIRYGQLYMVLTPSYSTFDHIKTGKTS